MNKLAVNANTLWLYAVLAHIAGSIVVSVMVLLPFGSYIFMTALWVIGFMMLNQNKRYAIPMIAGWILSLFVIYNIPAQYESSLLLNGIIILLVIYVCQLREVKLTEFCHIEPIPVKQWGLLVLLAIALIIIAGYINGISMLVFYNGTANSLQEVGTYFPESIIVFALVPAFSEEILFRGCIYREIGGVNKNVFAIFLSAVFFALLHMNFNQMSYAFVMGLFFGYIVWMTDNLSFSILIHAVFNCFSVITFAFPEHFLIKMIMNCHVGAYYVFQPVFKDANGVILKEAIIVGGILFVAMMIFAAALLYLLKKENRIDEIKAEEANKKYSGICWKPDREFGAGCIGCILMAVFYELSMM